MGIQKGVDYAALKEQTLKLAREGMFPHTIAKKLGISGHTTTKWIREAGIAVGHDAHYAARRREVIKLAWRGYTAAAIARMTGDAEKSVHTWMKEAGFNTAWDGDSTLPCPACGGRMEKQELFFWKCNCGGEWWPPEDMVPDNPEEWTTAARLAVDPSVVTTIRQLLDEGKTYPEIAAALNEAGHKPAKGAIWTRSTVKHFIAKHKLKGDYQEQREQIEDICRTMALKHYNCQQIADRLNADGFTTRQGQQWTTNSVWLLLQTLLPGLEMKTGRPGLRVKLPERMKDGIHPWKRAEDARRMLSKARRENALHNMQGGHDV